MSKILSSCCSGVWQVKEKSMGLKIQPTRRIGSKITTLIAVFALIVQPMYGLVAERVANAAVGDPVCISGGDCYSTIQSAINAASSDATITASLGHI